MNAEITWTDTLFVCLSFGLVSTTYLFPKSACLFDLSWKEEEQIIGIVKDKITKLQDKSFYFGWQNKLTIATTQVNLKQNHLEWYYYR